MEDRARMRFSMRANFLAKTQLRSALYKLKSDVAWKEPSATFKIDENEGFFSSVFYVVISDISVSYAVKIKEKLEYYL